MAGVAYPAGPREPLVPSVCWEPAMQYRQNTRAVSDARGVSPPQGSIVGILNAARIFEWIKALVRVRRAYIRKHRRLPRLLIPRRYTEKIQWRKLFDLNPTNTILCDKLAVRDFIAERVGTDVLIPLLWAGDDPGRIPFNDLIPPYVLKSAHASGQVWIIRTRDHIERATAESKLQAWINVCYGAIHDEPGYVAVPRRIMIERMLHGTERNPLTEIKLFLFDGRVRFVKTTLRRHDELEHGAFYDRDWQPLDWFMDIPNRPELCRRPKRYNDIIAIAERLGKDFDHLRVDIYEAGDRIWVGELTLYPWSGLSIFTPDEADTLVGSYWPIQKPLRRALAAIIWRSRPASVDAGGRARPRASTTS
jgi:hypothetical protein